MATVIAKYQDNFTLVPKMILRSELFVNQENFTTMN